MGLVIAIILSGIMCLNPYTHYTADESYVKLVPDYHEYTVGITTLSFTLINNSDMKFLYSEPTTILKRAGDDLYIPYIEMSGTDIAILLMPGSSNTETLQIREEYGQLSEGTYAIEIVLYAFPNPENYQPYIVLGKFNIVNEEN